jgi:polyferredoxin/tetratricopeptide (TPR) repeat protein
VQHAGVSLALPVLATPAGAAKPRLAKSRIARWRAGVLIGVQVLILLHILQWLVVGMTLSPIEPSESQHTLRTGVVNAGAVFFLAAIVSTLIFGRFFCGWGCHIVALQDLCGHWMTRLGIRPKPFRTRLLVLIPLGLAIYMFIWPVITRWLVGAWPDLAVWLGAPPAWSGWSRDYIVQDFWATFPPWYIAVPFILICTFGAVYFLGNKGFCTYGCPYGGFFGPADLVAPGKIRVTDACHQCGHCTAACTSNVRVHEEVRDFGMVVDPGCMKCLDCVSVCPNDALYFGLGTPTVLAKPKDAAARARRSARTGNLDLSLTEEFVCLGVFLALLLGYRGFMNQVPLLMAVGIAGIGMLCTWKLWRLALDPHVRVQNIQLKHKGRLRPAGAAFILLTALLLAGAAWGLAVRWELLLAARSDDLVRVPRDVVLSGTFTPDEPTRAAAAKALDHYERAGPFWHAQSGGVTPIGWTTPPVRHVRMAYLAMILGRREQAESHLRTALATGTARDDLVFALVRVMELGGADVDAAIKVFQDALARQSDLHAVRLVIAGWHVDNKRPQQARGLYESALADRSLRWSARVRRDAGAVFINTGERDRGLALLDQSVALASLPAVHDTDTLRAAAESFAQLNMLPRAVETLRAAVVLNPTSGALRHDLAMVLSAQGEGDAALAAMIAAAELDRDNPLFAERAAQLLEAAGRVQDAAKWQTEARTRADRASRIGGPGGLADEPHGP